MFSNGERIIIEELIQIEKYLIYKFFQLNRKEDVTRLEIVTKKITYEEPTVIYWHFSYVLLLQVVNILSASCVKFKGGINDYLLLDMHPWPYR